MTKMNGATKIKYLASASLSAVFLINIITPPDVVFDILYLCSIVIVFRQNTQTIVGFSVAACVLIVINAIFFDAGFNLTVSLWINRGISLFAIVTVTVPWVFLTHFLQDEKTRSTYVKSGFLTMCTQWCTFEPFYPTVKRISGYYMLDSATVLFFPKQSRYFGKLAKLYQQLSHGSQHTPA